MKKERVRSKHGFKGFGTFILGWLIGFICTIGIIAGVGYWAYTSLSVKRLEKLMKTDITSNNDIEKLTIKKVVGIVQGIASTDSDAYTIAKLEEDFGVTLLDESNPPFGIDLSVIKNSPIKELKTAINDTIDTLTFVNVLEVMDANKDLGLLDMVLDSEVKYYVQGGKMYTADDHNTEVGFKYTIDGNLAKFANGTHMISSGVVTTTLRHIPINEAMGKIDGVTQDLKIYEVMGYTREATAVEGKYIYKDNGIEVTGIMKSLAGYSVDALSDSKTFDNIYIYEVMGYTQIKVAGEPITYKYEEDNGDAVTGIMAKIAGKTISQLSSDTAFNDITVADAMNYHYDEDTKKWYTSTTLEKEVKGVIKHLAGSNMKKLSDDVQALTVGKILDVKQEDATGVVKALWSSNLSKLKEDIDKLTLGSALGVEFSNATGFIKTFYNTPIKTLSSKIETIKVYEAMGYYYDEPSNKYYQSYDEESGTYADEVELIGIMKAIANLEVNKLNTEIDKIKAVDVFTVESTPILKLFIKDYGKPTEDRTKLNNITIMNMPNEVVEKLNSSDTTIGSLIDAGVITRTDIAEDDPVRLLTISGLIDLALKYS